MTRALLPICILLCPVAAWSDPLRSSYSTGDGRAGTVIIACPSQDGSFSAAPCSINKPGTVSYIAPNVGSIVSANTPVTVFGAGTVATGCDFVNTGSAILYIDFTTTASAGASTSIPLQPGQSFHCPYPPAGAVSAVAAQPQSFVAIRY